MKKAELLFDAITNIRPDLVEEALDHRFRKAGGQLRRYMALAACLALVVGVGFASLRFMGMGGSKSDAAAGGMDTGMNQSVAMGSPTTETVTETETTEELSPDAALDQEQAMKQFRASVTEIGESWIMVEPMLGQWIGTGADRIVVSLPSGMSYTLFSVGDAVEVTFDGTVQESYPARLTAVDIVIIP